MPTAITVTPAIWPIRFEKLTAVKKMFVFAVKKIVIAMIPTITGTLPTSPPLNASQRAARSRRCRSARRPRPIPRAERGAHAGASASCSPNVIACTISCSLVADFS